MPASSPCSWLRIAPECSVGTHRHRRGFHAQLAQQRARSLTAGLEPKLVEPQHVLLRVAATRVADLAQCIHQWLKFGGQLREYLAQYPAPSAREGCGQRTVGPSTHRDVIVDVDQLAGKAVCEEPC